MARQQCIVGIGEAVLVEGGEEPTVAGMAASATVHARRFGHRGIALTRIGQDPAGEELVRVLQEAEVDVSHVQYDPDRPTARRRRLGIPGRSVGAVSEESAFNHLQWDFDLDDVAQITDAAFFGLVAQRDGQSRSVIARYLDSCTHAIRVFDLTNRDEPVLDRRIIDAMLHRADAAVLDASAIGHVMPGSSGNPWRETVLKFLKNHELAFALTIEPITPGSDNGEQSGLIDDGSDDAKRQSRRDASGHRLVLHTSDDAWSGENQYAGAAHTAMIMAVLHGMLLAWEPARTMQLVGDIADFTREQPDKPIPEAMLTP